MDPIDADAPEGFRDEPSEEQPLLGEAPSQSLLLEPTTKLRCFVYLLALLAVGFTTAVIETEEFAKSNCSTEPALLRNDTEASNWTSSDRKQTFTPNEWASWTVKNIYSLSTIVVIAYLQKVVFVQAKIPIASMPHPRQENRFIVLTDVLRYIKTPKAIGSYPSVLFVVTFIIFSVSMILCGGVEIVCGAIDATRDPGMELPELFRRVLLVTFCVMQTRLFVIHYRHSVQWKLSATWFCGCHLLAMNIASWFFNVGLEVREIETGCGKKPEPGTSYCETYHITKFTAMLYPFGIEYYVMGAFMSYTLMANTGRLGQFLRSHICELPNGVDRALDINLRSLLSTKPTREAARRALSEFGIIRRHSMSFSLGLGFVVVSLIVSVFASVRKDEQDLDEETKTTFYCAQIFLYSCGFVCTLNLLRSLNRAKGAHLSSIHLSDRLLLWLGAAAIVVNDSNNFWITLTLIDDKSAISLANSILLCCTCALNVVQSLAQVYALECALLRKFRTPSRRGKDGRALLNVLIMLNAAEWIINTVCFSMFFPKELLNRSLVLSLVCMPLQVFFRFHSAACIHEFKRHCEVPAPRLPDRPRQPPRQPNLVLTFPTVTSLVDSLYGAPRGSGEQTERSD